jgi:hypothetical protein
MANSIVAGNSTNGGTAISTDTSGTLNIVTGSGSGATAIAIDTSQNVGIGTSSPATKLQVNGTANGNVATLIGNASLIGSAPTNTGSIRLIDNPTASTAAGGIEFLTSTFGSGYGWKIAAIDSSGVSLTFATRQNSASWTESMRLDPSGALILAGSTAQKATGTTWSNPSDKRLKNNIQDYTKGITELMQVRVKEWEYNGKGGTIEGTKGLGVIADEVMEVLPNTVDTYEAKLNTDDEETTEIKKFDATEITWLLVKTAQEQQTMILELKAELDALKAKVGE